MNGSNQPYNLFYMDSNMEQKIAHAPVGIILSFIWTVEICTEAKCVAFTADNQWTQTCAKETANSMNYSGLNEHPITSILNCSSN